MNKTYKVNIKETLTDEGCTYWIDRLTLQSWKYIKQDLINQAIDSGYEHELTLTEVINDTNSHFLGATKERIITKVKFGAGVYERYLKQVFGY